MQFAIIYLVLRCTYKFSLAMTSCLAAVANLHIDLADFKFCLI